MRKTSSLTDTFLKYRNRLRRAISPIVNGDDIEDIVQEAFIKSYEAELKQEIQYERTYMLKTVRNLALNHVKSAASQHNMSMDDMDRLPHEFSLDKHVESKERFIHFCRATDSLSADVKRVFLLKKVYGMRQKDIADLIGISESTVEKHVAKGLMQCARFLKEVSADGSEPKASQDKKSSNHE